MFHYIIKRLLLMIPTLFGIMLLSFIIIQAAPGGPVEQMIAKIQGHDVGGTGRFTASEAGDMAKTQVKTHQVSTDVIAYRGAQGLEPELIERLEQFYGFDKPAHERFWIMITNYLRFDFGQSFYKDQSVIDLVIEKMPVSISIGLWTMLFVYLISIPLGIKKAVRDGSRFDVMTSAAVSIGYAVPGFLFAILLIVLFAGGSYWSLFPLRGLTSPHWHEMGLLAKILDYLWHLVLPITASVISGFAGLTMLTKNSFIEEIGKQYTLTAKAKGLSEDKVLYRHIFRNAMLIVIAGFPGAFISVLFTGAFLIEVIFSLDGLGLLGFESTINRDYPVIFGTLFIFSLFGLVLNLLGDLMYVWIDPRIDFEKREV